MNRHLLTYCTLTGWLLIQIILTVPQPLQAADCKSLAEEIRRERSIINQKTKLADAVKVCPNSAELNFSYGYTLERLRDYDLAVKYYKAAAALDNKSASAWFGLGDVYTVLGDAKSAVESYEKGLKFAPGDRRAKKSLELALGQLHTTGEKQKVMAAPEPQPKATTAPPSVSKHAAVVNPPKKVTPVIAPPQKVVAEVKESPPSSVAARAESVSVPLAEQPGKEESEPSGNAPVKAKKMEKLLVLEPRALKIPMSKSHAVNETNKAKAEDVGQAVAAATESAKKQAPEVSDKGTAVSPAVKSALLETPAVAPGASSVKSVAFSIQPGKRVDPQWLQRNTKDQVVEFRLALESEAARRQPLILPDFKKGIDLTDFKKIQEGRREEIANSAKIDALPIDIERPIVPYFKDKRLATPQEAGR
ncbi:MAG: hypothetical protein A2511_11560 [Deltaproteobacteria bacterium RIFOXYD12_FULL_50_9]|nr:MAG: hypothetical protein A2511_11560 [Deltaproteobacteria bacterium RIFOXYD12_FULL_50_9]